MKDEWFEDPLGGYEEAIQASFSGKILRIDHHPEGEKIRLSVLYQQGPE